MRADTDRVLTLIALFILLIFLYFFFFNKTAPYFESGILLYCLT